MVRYFDFLYKAFVQSQIESTEVESISIFFNADNDFERSRTLPPPIPTMH